MIFSYELSFWSDLAKKLFSLQEEGQSYTISYEPKDAWPTSIHVHFPDISCVWKLDIADWMQEGVIASIETVQTALHVHEVQDREIAHIFYEQEHARFVIHKQGTLSSIPYGDKHGIWTFVPEQGFFMQREDLLLDQSVILGKQIPLFLTRHRQLIQQLGNVPFHEGEHLLQYHLFFTEDDALHIEAFLQEKGDLQQPYAACFGSFAYIPVKGFFAIVHETFPLLQMTIASQDLLSFLEEHRAWFQKQEGFSLHLWSVDSSLSYRVEESGTLQFIASIDLAEHGMRDLGEVLFIPGKGFFPKRKDRAFACIPLDRAIKAEEVASFLRCHEAELRGFMQLWSARQAVEEAFLDVKIEPQGIHIRPVLIYAPHLQEVRRVLYREYIYVEHEGFSKIPITIPEAFFTDKVLSPQEEAYFLSHIELFTPWIRDLDPQLVLPKTLSCVVQKMEQKGHEWNLHIVYRSKAGDVTMQEILKALSQGKEWIYSSAGLLELQRFHHLRKFPKRCLHDHHIRFTTLEWMRFQGIEDVVPEEGIKTAFTAFQQQQGSSASFDSSLLQSTLRPYQDIGARWLWFLYEQGLSGLLCDEMGLGKTHQAMALLGSAFHQKQITCLVICPTSVIYHWEDLLHRFLPSLRVHVYHGTLRVMKPCDVVITSYGIARSDSKLLQQQAFAIGIYDEIQQAKNIKSRTHKALSALLIPCVIGLTGTPIENHLLELKALFDLLLPHYLPAHAQFIEQFVIPIEKEQDLKAKELLKRLTKPFILRRKKKDVLLELPEKVERIVYCDLSDEQKLRYQEILSHYSYIDQEAPSQDVSMHIFALFSKLKQLCDHPCLLTNSHDYQEHASGKWDLFLELLQEARESGQKVVVFSQYLHMLDLMKSYLSAHHIGFREIRGSTQNRKEALHIFRTEPACEVFLASLQAAGVGIDLTAASVVIHYDRWWNPAKENQATDRVHRMGQSRGVQVCKLICKDTLEEHIHALILKKEKLLDTLVGFDEQEMIKSLSQEELYALFRLVAKP